MNWGMYNDRAILALTLAAPLKVKHSSTLSLASPLLGIYPREIKTYAHKKKCIKNVHSSFIHDSSKLKTT